MPGVLKQSTGPVSFSVQSQGKVERSHMTLHSKMEYDFVQIGAKGVNWAQSLPSYQYILNKDLKEVLAYKTRFEVYFARKCNTYNTAMTDEEVVENTGKCSHLRATGDGALNMAQT